ARLLADEEAIAERARAFLAQALSSPDASLRAQAGVAIASLDRDVGAPLEALARALDRETDEQARLQMARAIARRDPGRARPVLDALASRVVASMVGVQAAALLCELGDGSARERLERALGASAEPLVRRTAVRALARDARAPERARAFLRDGDRLVRIYAAGGILAAAAASAG
ncbi:MAG: hypothetical protein IT378_13590, partial [Sandaracinaceae bacterium]|nr:hypothetical protein [Sandaracinaceae bacterium]